MVSEEITREVYNLPDSEHDGSDDAPILVMTEFEAELAEDIKYIRSKLELMEPFLDALPGLVNELEPFMHALKDHPVLKMFGFKIGNPND